MRVSIYLGKDREWLIDLLKNRAAGGKLTGRKTSVGQELLYAAEQYFLQRQYDISKHLSERPSAGSDGFGG